MPGEYVVAQFLDSARSIIRKSARRVVSLLLVAPMILCAGLARAQLAGLEPGLKDPVGPPASYITLRSDDLAYEEFTSGNVNQMTSGAIDNQGRFSTPLPAASGTGVFGLGNSISRSGRILSQENDQIVNVGRSPDGRALQVRFPLGSAYNLPGLHAAISNVPDQFSVAVGDLDKIPDASGANHDEVAVAYATAAGSPVNLAVLNYTSVDSDGSQPQFVTQIPVPATGPLLKYRLRFSPASNLLSLAIGDFDGDGQNEIALAYMLPATFNDSDAFSLQVAIFRYKHERLTDTPCIGTGKNSEFYCQCFYVSVAFAGGGQFQWRWEQGPISFGLREATSRCEKNRIDVAGLACTWPALTRDSTGTNCC